MKPLLSPLSGSKAIFYGALYFALSLPFQTDWFPPVLGIVAMGFGWLFSFDLTRKFKDFATNRKALLLSSLFIIPLLWMPLSEDLSEGWKKVVLSIAFLVFPLMISSLPKAWTKKQRDFIFGAFIVGCFFSSGFLLLNSLWHYQQTGQLLTHQQFAVQPRISVHYFALYQVFALFSLLHFSFQNWSSLNKLWRLSIPLAFVVFLAVIFLAAARLQILLLIPGVIILFFHHLKPKVGVWKTVFLQLLIVAGIVAAALILPGSRHRLQDAYREVVSISDPDSKFQTNHRYYIWKNSFKVISNQWLFGTGTGSADPALYKYLKEEKARFWLNDHEFYTLAKKKYNFHNSYLQQFAAFGLTGFLALMGVFIFGFLQHYNYLPAFIFLLFSALSFLTESMLERQAGVYFFAFFYSFLIVQKR